MPSLGDSPGHLSVDEGVPVNLSCQASQFVGLDDPITFGWFKVKGQSEVDIVTNGRVTNATQNHSPGKFTGKLTFTFVNRMDSGSYKCKAFNVHGGSNLSAIMSLDVTCKCAVCHKELVLSVKGVCFFSDGPESVAIQPVKPLGVKGKAIVLNCSTDGHPTPSYEWQLPQGQPRAGQSLQLSNVQFEDGGTYTCVVRNTIHAGEKTANRSVELQVEGKLLSCTLKGNEIFMYLFCCLCLFVL